MTTIANANVGTITVSYNGVTWPVETETVSARAEPEYDEAGRTITCVKYAITLRAVFVRVQVAGNELDDTLSSIRTLLNQPGGKFVYDNVGLGDISINTSEQDVRWGPKPRVLTFKPKGANEAAEVVWTVEFALAECPSPFLPGEKGVMAFNYSLNDTTDKSGYNKRVYSGYIEVAQARRNQRRNLDDTADRLKEFISPQVPTHFRRTAHNFTLSQDKCRLNFSITDELMPPNIPPPGIVMMQADHTIETPVALVAMKWRGTLNVSYEVAWHVRRDEILGHFRKIVKDRVTQTIKTVNAQAGGGAIPIPRTLVMREPEVYDKRNASFTLTYDFTLSEQQVKEEKIVLASGLWRRIPGKDWDSWNKSMNDLDVFHPRGIGQLKFQTQDDRIVDLCLDTRLNSPADPFDDRNPNNRGFNQRPGDFKVLGDAFQTDIPPQKSWLDFQIGIHAEVIDDVVESKLLPVDPIIIDNKQGAIHAANAGYNVPYRKAPESLIQVRAKPTIYIHLVGYAERVGHNINPPTITRIGNIVPVQSNTAGMGFRTWVDSGGLTPIVKASWHFRYLLPKLPTGLIVAPPNPLYGSVKRSGPLSLSGFGATRR